VLPLGKLLIAVGLVFVAVGVLFLLVDRLSGFRIGRLPGDFVYRRGNFTLYFPLATSILISVVLTVLFWLLGRR
jgi:hypothetical protein